MDNPSISEANKMLRVLKGERLKFTVLVIKPDGKTVEYQSDSEPDLKWEEATRSCWIVQGYKTPVMEYVPGSVILTEENPKA